MSTVSSATSSSTTGSSTATGYASLNADDFLKLFLAEMQNQDPLQPMETSEIMSQISSIREIQANTQLTETLEAVTLGQNLATGSSLISRTVVGLNEQLKTVTGTVDSVSIEDGEVKIHVGDSVIDLNNISKILESE